MFTHARPTTNADSKEVEKFSALAHTWWDSDGPYKSLHSINPLRMQWITQYTGLTQKIVLDVGCGGGILSEALAKLGAKQVVGIDLAEKSLRIAQLHALESKLDTIQYKCIATEQLAQTHAKHFDLICCMEMLEHTPRPESIVQACASLVKPGGWIFFSTLNRNPKAFLQAIIGAEYMLGLIPKGTHEYAKFLRPNELAAFCESVDLDLKSFAGLSYNPVSKRYTLNQDTSVNYFLATQKPA